MESGSEQACTSALPGRESGQAGGSAWDTGLAVGTASLHAVSATNRLNRSAPLVTNKRSPLEANGIGFLLQQSDTHMYHKGACFLCPM